VSPALAIAGRELRAYFLSPGGYVVAALFMLVNGWFFVRHVFSQGDMASLRPIFAFSMVVFALVCPAVTMRTISEELRLGTIETLMTCPVRATEVILGKFTAALGFVVLLLSPTVLFVLALEMYGRPDYGELLCGYLGLILAASAFCASGILASTLTPNQLVAYLVTVFFWIILILAAKGLPQTDILPIEWREDWSTVLSALDPDLRLRDFTIGLIDSANVVYFCSVTLVLLIASVKSLDARRWR
jgi:ABC-2 type transport system permease protein